MVDYGLVSRNINALTNQIRVNKENQRRHETEMGQQALTMAQLGLQKIGMQNQMKLAVAKAEYNKFQNETVSGRQAIMSQPDWSYEEKQNIISTIPKEVLDLPYKRETWQKALNQSLSEFKESEETKAYRSDRLGLQRQELGQTKAYQDKMLGLKSKELDIKKLGLENKKVPISQKKYQDKIAIQNLMGKYGLSEGLDGNLQSPDMSEAEAAAMKAEAARLGLNVYFEKGTVTDTGSGWNPFDNKEIDVYNVRAIAPGGQVKTGTTTKEPKSNVVPATDFINEYLKRGKELRKKNPSSWNQSPHFD